jgi:hypothetical protein
MYQKMSGQMHMNDYTLSDIFTLAPDNRWVKMANIVPWEMAEEKYMHMFRKNGRKAKDIRMALGALLIQHELGCSDTETVQHIKENPYLQHFIGMKEWSNEAPFDASLMVWFRKRLSKKVLGEINEEMCRRAAQPEEEKPDETEDDPADDDTPHGGTLIVDATCAPADIAYPTDTGLLAKAIEKTDGMIDEMHAPHVGERSRPRTYREKSRKVFTGFVKQRKPSGKVIRATRRKQLGYLRRNLGFVEEMLARGDTLSEKQFATLETIRRLYVQQQEMYDNRTHSVEDRIVSIQQPHIRPIVRGKANARTEFGAKLALSVVNGYTFVDCVSYDSFNEGSQLKEVIALYRERFGMLPSKILADTIYRNRNNRAMCKELGIKLSGLPLGRRNAQKHRQQRKEFKADCGARNEVEGKIGTAKTRYGMGRIRPRLPETGEAAIILSVMAMNLCKLAKAFLRQFSGTFVLQKYSLLKPA